MLLIFLPSTHSLIENIVCPQIVAVASNFHHLHWISEENGKLPYSNDFLPENTFCVTKSERHHFDLGVDKIQF
jgi:hypothetical protein